MPTYRDWPDGKAHSIPYAQHLINMRAKAGNPMTLPRPPVGSYDSAIDYNARAAQRGYDQTFNDAQTLFERGQQDYDLQLGDLTTSRDRMLGDLQTNENRLGEDYGFRTGENTRQYGILGRRQAEGAAQRGITSAGLLAKSNAVRGENQQRDQGQIDLWRNRGMEDIATQRRRTGDDFTRAKTGLDLGRAREFGGFGGNTILNPLTGAPEFGSLLTSLTRAGNENTFYQGEMDNQRAQSAAARGYVSPLTRNQQKGGTVAIGGTPVTPQMWQNGLLLQAMLGKR